MSWPLPKLSDLTTRTRNAFRAYLPGSDAWIWPNNINPSAKVFGGLVYEIFGFADYIFKQRFAITADSENLELHAAEYGLARRPAAPAGNYVTFTARTALSVDVAAVLQRADGVQYIATSPASLAGPGTLAVPVVAAADGKLGNALGGTPLAVVSGVTGDADVVVASDGIVGGADIEPDGEPYTTDLGTLRGRILFRKRNPPHGGNAADYVQWASQVSGVTRVYVERRWNGAGTVRVFPLMDDLYADGVPGPADIARVAQYVIPFEPSGAIVSYQAPSRMRIDVSITGLKPATSAIKEAVLSELRATFRRLSAVAGSDVPHPAMPYLAVPTSFARQWVWQSVANAAGEYRAAVASPAADVPLLPGQFPVLGTVSFLP